MGPIFLKKKRLRQRPHKLGAWYQDLGTKIYGEPERRSLSVCRGARGAAGPPPGGLGGWKPPRNSRGSGGRQPPSTILGTYLFLSNCSCSRALTVHHGPSMFVQYQQWRCRLSCAHMKHIAVADCHACMAMQPKSGTILYLGVPALARGRITDFSPEKMIMGWNLLAQSLGQFCMYSCKFQNDPDQKSDPKNLFVSRPGNTTPTLQISPTSLSHKYLTYMERWLISKNKYERRQFQPNSLKLLTCYVPRRSKNLFFGLIPWGANHPPSRSHSQVYSQTMFPTQTFPKFIQERRTILKKMPANKTCCH